MAGLKKPKKVEKKVEAPKSAEKLAQTTKDVLKSIQDRQTSDSNNAE